MLNAFVMKRWTATLVSCFLPTLGFMVGLQFYNFWYAMGIFFIVTVVCVVISKVLLANPLTAMLEGKGLLCLNLDSTGIIRPFILGVRQPYIQGLFGKKKVDDVFDRETVLTLDQVRKGEMFSQKDANGVEHRFIKFDEDLYNKARFGLWQWPVLLYNAQMDTLLTKDFLSNQEKLAFAEHSMLYLNRKLEELTSAMRDFGRYVVETLKPKESIWGSKWIMWVVIAGAVMMLILFGGPLIDAFMNFGGSAQSAASNVVNPVMPQ